MVTGYEQGFYRDIGDLERHAGGIRDELSRIVGFVDETREFIHESVGEEDGLVAVLRDIRDAMFSPPPQVVITIEARCWCGGKIGFREPGDEQGLGCMENLSHAWRSGEHRWNEVQ